MNNYFINITKNLDLKPLAISNIGDIDEITKHLTIISLYVKQRIPIVNF